MVCAGARSNPCQEAHCMRARSAVPEFWGRNCGAPDLAQVLTLSLETDLRPE